MVLELKRKDQRLGGVELQLFFDELGRNLVGREEPEVSSNLSGLGQLSQRLDFVVALVLLTMEDDERGTSVQSKSEVGWRQVSEERDRVLANELADLARGLLASEFDFNALADGNQFFQV